MLNFRFGINENANSIINILICFGAGIGCIHFNFKILKLTYSYQHWIDYEPYTKTIGVITQGVHQDKPFYFKIYSFLFLIRRFLLWVEIVFIGEVPELQIAAVSLTNFSYFIWITYASPFQAKMMNITEILVEFGILLVTLGFNLFLLSSEESSTISLSLIIISWITIIIGCSTAYVKGVAKMWAWFRKRSSKVEDNPDSNLKTTMTEMKDSIDEDKVDKWDSIDKEKTQIWSKNIDNDITQIK